MPLKGRQRTKHQKAHTTMMQKQWWLLKSPARAKAVNPMTRHLISSMEKKHKREMEKVKKAIEAQPPFALLCRCWLTFVALALIVDFYSQPLILHFFSMKISVPHTIAIGLYIPCTLHAISGMYNLLSLMPFESGFWQGQTNVNNYDHIWWHCPSPYMYMFRAGPVHGPSPNNRHRGRYKQYE